MYVPQTQTIKAIRAKIVFCEGLEVDGYQMPNGEYRVGLSSASKALGYGREWLSDILGFKTPRTAKALQGMGFSGKIQKVFAQSNQGNSYQDSTISLDDFNHLIAYGTIKGKQKAIALQTALTKIALTDFFRDSFNDVPLTIPEKRSLRARLCLTTQCLASLRRASRTRDRFFIKPMPNP